MLSLKQKLSSLVIFFESLVILGLLYHAWVLEQHIIELNQKIAHNEAIFLAAIKELTARQLALESGTPVYTWAAFFWDLYPIALITVVTAVFLLVGHHYSAEIDSAIIRFFGGGNNGGGSSPSSGGSNSSISSNDSLDSILSSSSASSLSVSDLSVLTELPSQTFIA